MAYIYIHVCNSSGSRGGGDRGSETPPCHKISLKRGKDNAFWKPKLIVDPPFKYSWTRPCVIHTLHVQFLKFSYVKFSTLVVFILSKINQRIYLNNWVRKVVLGEDIGMLSFKLRRRSSGWTSILNRLWATHAFKIIRFTYNQYGWIHVSSWC